MESLFEKDYVYEKIEKKASYCIDVSGSTDGYIIEEEKKSAEQLMKYIEYDKIIKWDNKASEVKSLSEVKGGGGTYPIKFVPLIKESNYVIIYTDGQIDQSSMESFSKEMEFLNDIQIIVVFTLGYGYNLQSTISRLNSQVNMSIPDGFVKIANDICIVLNIGGDHRILMSNGCFDTLHSEIPKLEEDLKLEKLPVFDMAKLPKTYTVGLAKNLIKLPSYEFPFNIDKLYEIDIIPDEILDKLNNRLILPKINSTILLNKLSFMEKRLLENPILSKLREQLLNMMIMKKNGSPEHKELLKQYKEAQSTNNSTDNSRTLHYIHRLHNALTNYKADKTSFILGSSRANNSKDIQNANLENIDECDKILCPVLGFEDEEEACILLKIPSDTKYLNEFTNDTAIDSPFTLGAKMVECVTPEIFGVTISKTLDKHPLTRELLLGYIPLSKNPETVMLHMGKLFGKREMPHLFLAYISMMCHVMDKEWINKELIIKQLKVLIEEYQISPKLSLFNDSHHLSMKEALKKILTYNSEYLIYKSPSEIIAITKIVNILIPDLVYDEEKMKIKARFIENFTDMIKRHQVNEDMEKFIMEVDEYGHYSSIIKNDKALIGQLFWNDTNGIYRNKYLYNAIEFSLSDKKYGESIKNILRGEYYEIPEISFPEPEGIHFIKVTPENKDFRPLNKCIFCEYEFKDSKDKMNHLKQEYGKWFFNGLKNTKIIMYKMGIDTDTKELFKNIKLRLFKEYGKDAGQLYTQWCKNTILNMIDHFKKSGLTEIPHSRLLKKEMKLSKEKKCNINFIEGDILKFAEDGNFDVILYGCNCFHHLEGGLALQMKIKYPMAYQAEVLTPMGDINKLGTITTSTCGKLTIVNAYIQHHWSQKDTTGACLRYDAIENCLKEIKKNFPGKHIGMPKIGCGLAGGNWGKIFKIIEKELADEKVTVVIYK